MLMGDARRVRHRVASDDGDVMMIWKWWERNCRNTDSDKVDDVSSE